jgi:hypothetical protein
MLGYILAHKLTSLLLLQRLEHLRASRSACYGSSATVRRVNLFFNTCKADEAFSKDSFTKHAGAQTTVVFLTRSAPVIMLRQS